MKKNKIVLISLFIFVFMLSFALISSATSVMYNSSDTALNDMIEESSTPNDVDLMYDRNVGSYVNYGNVSNGNFVIFIQYLSSYDNPSYETYIFWVSDVEAFQIRYNGYTFDNFLAELDNNEYWDLSYMFSGSENAFNYFMNYQPVDTSTMVEWSTVDTVVKDWYTNDFDAPVYENIDISSESSLNSFLNDNVNVANEYDKRNSYSEGYSVGHTEGFNEADEYWLPLYEDISNEVVALEGEITNLEANLENSYNLGYGAGMTDAGAFKDGITSIMSSPMYFLGNVLQFDVFGINVFSIVCSIFTLLIIAYVVKKLAN